jgi:hypothetical protein
VAIIKSTLARNVVVLRRRQPLRKKTLRKLRELRNLKERETDEEA